MADATPTSNERRKCEFCGDDNPASQIPCWKCGLWMGHKYEAVEQPSSNQIAVTIEILGSIERFAYANGYHELGYSPTKKLATELATYENGRVILTGEVDRLRARVRELESNRNWQCDCGEWNHHFDENCGECCADRPSADDDRREPDSRGPSA